ncbi:hypothetical protein HI850_009450 [bacterium SPL81]|nr:hypothetical protein [Acinetobacter baumannii]
MSSLVIDTCVLRLYDAPADPRYKDLFKWLLETGKLCVTKKLLMEYLGTGNKNIEILLAEFNRNSENSRLVIFKKEQIESFKDDNHFKYTCNIEDRYHAKLVFLSPRKKMVTQDNKLADDINNFRKVDRIQPVAVSHPAKNFYID